MQNNGNGNEDGEQKLPTDGERFLNGWKEIATYMGRGVRTVQRWEALGLPVRRPNRRLRSAVVASATELSIWIGSAPARELEQIADFERRIARLEAENAALRRELTAARDDLSEIREIPPKHSGDNIIRFRRQGA